MKVKVGNRIYDANNEPISIIFEKDSERIAAGEQISNMAKSDAQRQFVQYPRGMDPADIDRFTDLSDEQINYMESVPKNDPTAGDIIDWVFKVVIIAWIVKMLMN